MIVNIFYIICYDLNNDYVVFSNPVIIVANQVQFLFSRLHMALLCVLDNL